MQAHQLLTLADGRLAIVMRLMDRSLAELMTQNGRLPSDRVLAWARQIGGALQTAHDRGIHHRDIKPGNVLLSADQAFLADFGIATLADVDTSTTTALSLSPLFAPPERLDGGAEDPRSGDIYSFGATIFAALHGAPPFGTTLDGGIFGLTKRVVSDHLVPSPAIAPPVHAVLSRAMAKRPSERYTSINDLVSALVMATSQEATVRRTGPPRVEAAPPPWNPVDSTRLADPIAATVLKPGRSAYGQPPIEAPPLQPSSATSPPPAGPPTETRATIPPSRRWIAAGAVGVVVVLIAALVTVLAFGEDAPSDDSAARSTSVPGAVASSTAPTVTRQVATAPPTTLPVVTAPETSPPTAPPSSAQLLSMTPAEVLSVLHGRFPELGSECVDAPTTDGVNYQPHIVCNRSSQGSSYSLFAWGPDPGDGQPFLQAEFAGIFDGGELSNFQYQDQGLQGRMWRYDGEAVFMQILTTQSAEQADALMYELIEANRPS